MGRKLAERVKKGPGRKAKKQDAPLMTLQKARMQDLLPKKEDKKLSRHQVKRLKKRQEKKAAKAAKVEKESDEDEASDSDVEEDQESGLESDEPQGFTDDNKEWLKPALKRKLPMDSDDDDDDDGEEEEDSDDEDDLQDDFDDTDASSEDEEGSSDELSVEKAAKKLEKKQKRAAKQDNLEVQAHMSKREVFTLPSGQEIEREAAQPPDLQIIQMRIRDVTDVLKDFSKKREEGKSRQEYLECLRRDLCNYYNYNEFMMEKLMDMFPIAEIVDVLEANEVQRPVTIRTNSLKTKRRDLAQSLINRGVNLDPVGKWSKVGLVVYSSQVPLGATPEYLAGHYILQGASSLLPVMALAPQENERVLDVASAPGGKTTHIAALMRNTGLLYANDANKDRSKAVVGNLHRLGITNTVVCCHDGRKIHKVMSWLRPRPPGRPLLRHRRHRQGPERQDRQGPRRHQAVLPPPERARPGRLGRPGRQLQDRRLPGLFHLLHLAGRKRVGRRLRPQKAPLQAGVHRPRLRRGRVHQVPQLPLSSFAPA